VWLAAAGLQFCIPSVAQAQGTASFPKDQTRAPKEFTLSDRLPGKPSVPPSFSIPVEPLGYSAPGPIYLGQRNRTASLDFIDENRLLFSFRVPGLIHRQLESGKTAETDERQIRAVVLALPAGTVEAEALWTVHDRQRYLWMLKDGHFLLRDRDDVQQGDATLALKPLLHFPGQLLWLQLDPAQQFLLTDSLEPVPAPHPAEHNGPARDPGEAAATAGHSGDPHLSAGTSATVAKDGKDGQEAGEQLDLVVRLLHRPSGKVLLVSRARSIPHLAINSDGYVEALRGKGAEWVLNLRYFTGGTSVLGSVDSTCTPSVDFVSQRELLVAGCAASGGHKVAALSTDGRRLWESVTSGDSIWPLLVLSPDGSRLARETLAVSHGLSTFEPLDRQDVKGQLVRVFDAADGTVALETQANPVLDAGGNVAISTSGRRVAVLNEGAIQVFDLPAPPPVPAAGSPAGPGGGPARIDDSER